MKPPVTPKHFKFEISYGAPTTPLAYTFSNGSTTYTSPYPVNPRDTVHIHITGPGKVVIANLEVGTEKASASSPFAPLPSSGTTDIDVLKHKTLTVADNVSGKWGFTVSFTVRHNDDTSDFFYVPDPELQVGSTERDALGSSQH